MLSPLQPVGGGEYFKGEYCKIIFVESTLLHPTSVRLHVLRGVFLGASLCEYGRGRSHTGPVTRLGQIYQTLLGWDRCIRLY